MTTHVNIDIAKAASTSASVGSFFRPQIQQCGPCLLPRVSSDTTSICEVE